MSTPTNIDTVWVEETRMHRYKNIEVHPTTSVEPMLRRGEERKEREEEEDAG